MKKIGSKLLKVLPTKAVDKLQHVFFMEQWRRQGSINREVYDDYSASTAMMVRAFINSGFDQYNVLSVGGCVRHIVPILPMFNKLVHCTMIPIERKDDIGDLVPESLIQEYVGDFFELSADEEAFKKINFAISHVTVHCMNDTRYHNDQGKEPSRPYKFAEKLVSLCPNIKHVIISANVSTKESLVNNAMVLSEEKFVASFIDQGFEVKEKIYDKYANMPKEYEGPRYSKNYPQDYCKDKWGIVATYHFMR